MATEHDPKFTRLYDLLALIVSEILKKHNFVMAKAADIDDSIKRKLFAFRLTNERRKKKSSGSASNPNLILVICSLLRFDF